MIRPAAIYGETEQRHLPRIVQLMDMGLYTFNIGSPDSRVDWVYIDNLVQAYVLLIEQLAEKDSHAVGQIYSIADGEPINNFVSACWLCQFVYNCAIFNIRSSSDHLHSREIASIPRCGFHCRSWL